MAHPIVEADPRWGELQAERQRLAEAERIWRQRKAENDGAFHQAQRRHEEEVRAAILAGREPPEAPSYTGVPGDPFDFLAALRQIEAAEATVVASHVEEVVAACTEEEEKLRRIALEQWHELQATTAEIVALVNEARAARLAARPGSAFMTTPRVDVSAVLDAASRDTSLVERWSSGDGAVTDSRDQRPLAEVRTSRF